MCVYTHLCMVCCMESSDTAGHRLSQGSFIISTTFVLKQTSKFHYFCRNYAISCVSSEELIRVSRAPHSSFVIQCRLKCKFHTWFELFLMILTYFYDITGELMSHNCRMLCHVLMYPLVLCSEDRTFVSRHTDTVRHYLHQNLIIRDFRKFKLFQSQIICCV